MTPRRAAAGRAATTTGTSCSGWRRRSDAPPSPARASRAGRSPLLPELSHGVGGARPLWHRLPLLAVREPAFVVHRAVAHLRSQPGLRAKPETLRTWARRESEHRARGAWHQHRPATEARVHQRRFALAGERPYRSVPRLYRPTIHDDAKALDARRSYPVVAHDAGVRIPTGIPVPLRDVRPRRCLKLPARQCRLIERD